VVKKAGEMYQNPSAKAIETDAFQTRCLIQRGETGEAEKATAESLGVFLTKGRTKLTQIVTFSKLLRGKVRD
jgi:hypothetical protein